MPILNRPSSQLSYRGSLTLLFIFFFSTTDHVPREISKAGGSNLLKLLVRICLYRGQTIYPYIRK